jgi:hypothetical protein
MVLGLELRTRTFDRADYIGAGAAQGHDHNVGYINYNDSKLLNAIELVS